MKKNIHTNILEILKSKWALGISAALLVVSCGTQMGGYSETDGVYYDPNKDTLPEGIVYHGNEVGNEYNYEDSYIEDVRSREWKKNSVYWDDNATSSDWGSYSGTETHIYNDNWDWGSPWGYYNPYWGSRFSLGFSWGWGWNDPFMYGYHPYYYGYSPYWNYYGNFNPYWYYNNTYYGYYSPYYYGPAYRSQRSGANGRIYNSYQGGQLRQNNNSSGFRISNQSDAFRNSTGVRNMQAPRSGSDSPRFRTPQQRSSSMQEAQPRYSPPRQQPRYESTPRPQPTSPRSNDGGFRSGGFDRGSSSGGGIRSGSSSGVRSGGFR